MDLTCRWTLTPASPPRSPARLLSAWRTAMDRTGCSRRRSATARAASTKASRARSRSARQRCGFCWSSSAGRRRNGHRASSSSTATAETSRRWRLRRLCFVTRDATSGWCSCTAENADAHAGHTETSVLLHISPNDVWIDERAARQQRAAGRADATDAAGRHRRRERTRGARGPDHRDRRRGRAHLRRDGRRVCRGASPRWAPDRDGMLT